VTIASNAVSSSWAEEQSLKTRRQLILAAIRLMAKKGIDGVSLRSVNLEAGARNTSAAHYHFGNKLQLVKAAAETLAQEVAAIRRPLLAQLRERSAVEPISPRQIIESAYGPFMGLLFQPEFGLPGIRFLSRLIVDTEHEVRLVANTFTGPLVHEVFELLHSVMPEMPPRVLKMRLLFSLNNLINGMSDVLALETSPFGDMSTPGSLEAANHFLEYITAGICAPPSQMTDEFATLARGIIHTYSQAGPGSIEAERIARTLRGTLSV
jgi:AcrR family transcriptional regulator